MFNSCVRKSLSKICTKNINVNSILKNYNQIHFSFNNEFKTFTIKNEKSTNLHSIHQHTFIKDHFRFLSNKYTSSDDESSSNEERNLSFFEGGTGFGA